jgi:hypothetical protein
MNTEHRKLLAAAVMAATLAAAPAALAAEPPKATTVVTVYINAHGGGSIARETNESHAKMEKEGWRFADLEVHAENGDTEGVWVTYVKL